MLERCERVLRRKHIPFAVDTDQSVRAYMLAMRELLHQPAAATAATVNSGY